MLSVTAIIKNTFDVLNDKATSKIGSYIILETEKHIAQITN